VSVCVVCHTPVLYQNSYPRITQTTPHDSMDSYSFLTPKISAKFERRHRNGGTNASGVG